MRLLVVLQQPYILAFIVLFFLEVVFLAVTAVSPSKTKIKVLLVTELLSQIGIILLTCYFDRWASGIYTFLYTIASMFLTICYGALLFASAPICATRYARLQEKQSAVSDEK